MVIVARQDRMRDRTWVATSFFPNIFFIFFFSFFIAERQKERERERERESDKDRAIE